MSKKPIKVITKSSLFGTRELSLTSYDERPRKSCERRNKGYGKGSVRLSKINALPETRDRKEIELSRPQISNDALKIKKGSICRIENDVLVQYRHDGFIVHHEIKGVVFKKVNVANNIITYVSTTVPWIEHDDIRENIALMINLYDKREVNNIPLPLHTRYLLRRGSFGAWSYTPAFKVIKFMDNIRSGKWSADHLTDETLFWNSNALQNLRDIANNIYK